MERILNIEEVKNVKLDGEYGSHDGYKITTDSQEVLILISNGQDCCEYWGYFSSEDDYREFINSDLMDVEIVDEDRCVQSIKNTLKDEHEYGFEEGGVMFVNLRTSMGPLQFAVYNGHNGYYGHSVHVRSIQLEEDSYL